MTDNCSSARKDKGSFQMQEKLDNVHRMVEIMKGRNLNLDLLIDKVRNSIIKEKQLKKSKGGQKAVAMQDKKVKTITTMLSNQVQMVRSNCCDTDASIQTLKQDIDAMRKEKVIFDEIHGQLKDEFAEKKKEMHKILAKANEYNVARIAANSEIDKLKKDYFEYSETFYKEWKELDEIFLQQEKAKSKIHQAHQERKAQELKRMIEAGNLNPEQEAQIRAKIMAVESKVKRSSKQNRLTLTKVTTYEVAFNKIKEETGIDDLSELVENYIKTDDEAFSVYGYLQTMNDENETLEKNLQNIKDEMQRYMEEDKGNNSKKWLIKELEKQQKQVDIRLNFLNENLSQQKSTFEAVKEITERLFHAIGCLGSSVHYEKGITEDNIMIWLGTVEERACKLINSLQSNFNRMCQLRRSKSSQIVRQVSSAGTVAIETEEYDIGILPIEGLKSEKSGRKTMVGSDPEVKTLGFSTGPLSPMRSSKEFLPIIEITREKEIADLIQENQMNGSHDKEDEESSPVDISNLRKRASMIPSSPTKLPVVNVPRTDPKEQRGLPRGTISRKTRIL